MLQKNPANSIRRTSLVFTAGSNAKYFSFEKKKGKVPKRYPQIKRYEDSKYWYQAYDKEVVKLETIGGFSKIPIQQNPQEAEILNLVELYSKQYDNIQKKHIYKVRIAENGKFSRALQPMYSPVTNFECVRMFFSKVAQSSLHMFQLDVSTVYLNAELEKKKILYPSSEIFQRKGEFLLAKRKGVMWFKRISKMLVSASKFTSQGTRLHQMPY
eukprot:snap_masked-scaffold_39-processed-gene-2.72-mRNA-1 protein AED:1.00 eAED:1.00 QI:0/-1/0/0/-1/1/1/0/212